MRRKLPVQCLRNIFDQLTIFSISYEDGWINCGHPENTKADLAACGLVCRTWARPANEALYRHIRKQHVRERRGDMLLATLELNSKLADLVRVLDVEEKPQASAYILESERNKVARILKVVRNLQCYVALLQDNGRRFWETVLPTSQNSRLKTLALSANSINFYPPNQMSAFMDLPISLENVAFNAVDLSSVSLNLPNLRRLRLLWRVVISPITFHSCNMVTTLYLFDRPSEDLQIMLAWTGRKLKSLRVETAIYDFTWKAEYTCALASLECLELDLERTGILVEDEFPRSLQNFTWKSMTWDRVFEVLKRLLDADYLPNLRSMPALYLDAYHARCEGEGEHSLLEYEELRRHAFEALRCRGLPRPNDRSARVYLGRTYPVFDADLG